jgi:hypothetical protein
MWSSLPFVHQLISWWQNVCDICSSTLPIWTTHDLLRNGPSSSLLWPERNTVSKKPIPESVHRHCYAPLFYRCSLSSLHHTGQRVELIKFRYVILSVLSPIQRRHFEMRWHKLHQQTSSLISLISNRKSSKRCWLQVVSHTDITLTWE